MREPLAEKECMKNITKQAIAFAQDTRAKYAEQLEANASDLALCETAMKGAVAFRVALMALRDDETVKIVRGSTDLYRDAKRFEAAANVHANAIRRAA